MQVFFTVIEYAILTVLPFWATWKLFDVLVDVGKNQFSKRRSRNRADGQFRIVESEENEYTEAQKEKQVGHSNLNSTRTSTKFRQRTD